MNDNQLKTVQNNSLVIKITSFFAVIGIITLFLLAVWAIVQGADLLFNKGESNTANVSSVTDTSNQSVIFTLTTRMFTVGKPTVVTWMYNGIAEEPKTYSFTYSCGTNATLSVIVDNTIKDIICNVPQIIEGTQVTVLPKYTDTPLTDIELRIEARGLKDTTLITVHNESIQTQPVATTTASTTKNTTQSTPTNTSVAKQKTTPVVQSTPTPVKRIVSAYSGPADLVVEIQDTGILKKTSRKDVFVETSPIPTNKTAAVTFTVTNKGGETSGSWVFKAELPIEGDKDYAYTSPVQAPLLSGMQLQYTLSFDELLEENTGTILIKIVPSYSGDNTSNNKDSVKIKIDD